MSALTLDRLIFDSTSVATADASPNVGSYLRAGSDGDLISSTNIGGKEALDVNLVGGADSGIFAEDDAHTTGDNGQFILAVRKDAQGSLVSADGDYAPMQVDAQGRLRVITDIDLVGDMVGDDEVDSEDPLKIGGHAYDQSAALGSIAAGDKGNLAMDRYRRTFINDAPAIAAASVEVTTGLTEVALPTTALAGRTRMIIQNVSDKPVYVGPTGVTVGSGLQIDKGATLSLEIGQGVTLYGICGTASKAVRVFELA
jgi:hypothetical protein